MKVLVLSHMFPNPADPTLGISIPEQIRALRSEGAECVVVSPTPWVPRLLKWVPRWRKYLRTPRRDTVQGFQVEYLRVPVLPRGWLFGLYGFVYFLFCYPLVKRLVRQAKMDLIHAHTIMPDGFAAVLLGRQLNLPVVCTVHGSDVNIHPFRNRLSLWATKWALRRVEHLIAVSFRLRERIISLVGDRQVDVIHNGADPQLFKSIPKGQARERLGLPVDEKIILYAGNFVEVKGAKFLLEAFSRLTRTDCLLRLYLVGDGELKQDPISCASRLGILPRCKFVGRRPYDEMFLWFSMADCLALPSLSEGFPATLPEAMLCRVPIVATKVGGIPDIIVHGETGFLVPARDPAALANAIQVALSGGQQVSAMVDRAELTARAKFTWEANARQMICLYQAARATQGPSSQD